MTSAAVDGLEQLLLGYDLHIGPRVGEDGVKRWRAWTHGHGEYIEAMTPLEAAVAAAEAWHKRARRGA